MTQLTKVPNTAMIALSVKGKKKRRLPSGIVAAAFVWIIAFGALVLLAPILPLPDPAASDYAAVRMPPFTNWAHPLGTDVLGRDLLSRTLSGASVSMAVGLGSTAIAFVVGMALGTAAGYFGGICDRIVSWVSDILLAFPTIVALIALTTFMGPSLGTLILGMGIVAIPLVARLARSTTMGYTERDFVSAAKVMGASSLRTIWRELVPNVTLVVMPFALTMIALAITAEGSLSFLGLGVPPPQASWGGLMNEGRKDLSTLPYLVYIPATAMCLTLLSISLIADWFNRRSDSRDSRL